MREIKFRAWDKEKKEWININREFVNWGNSEYLNLASKNSKNLFLNDNEHKEGWVWEQFTGLHDKDGKEIYENDVVEFNDDSRFEGESDTFLNKGVVCWEDSLGGFTIYHRQNVPHDEDMWVGVEVMGNIHQDSQLL